MGQLHYHGLQKPVAEITPASQVFWLQSMNCALDSQSLSNFVTIAADNFVMLVSCARHLHDFYGVFSKLAPISSVFLQ